MNILFSVNKNYIIHLKDCIRSIVRFNARGGYDFYIMHTDLDEADKAELKCIGPDQCRFRLHYIYVDKKNAGDIPVSERYPLEIYYRIFAAMFLPDTLDRILYLDADIIVINSLEELYNMDFGGRYMLACTHTRKMLNRFNQLRLGMEEPVPYINSGVMLMNLKLLRKEQDFEAVADYAERYKKALILPDQDIITALYGDKTGLLDMMKYNLSDRMLALNNMDPGKEHKDLDWVRKNAVIIHYYGRNKPWNRQYLGILDVFYLEIHKDGDTDNNAAEGPCTDDGAMAAEVPVADNKAASYDNGIYNQEI